jgi:hypothetical protein
MNEDRLTQILKACAAFQEAMHECCTDPARFDQEAAKKTWQQNQDDFNGRALALYNAAIKSDQHETVEALVGMIDLGVKQIETIVPLEETAKRWPEDARTQEMVNDLTAMNVPYLVAVVKKSIEIPPPAANRPIAPQQPPHPPCNI